MNYYLRKIVAVVVVVAGPLMLVGCGGDDDDASVAAPAPVEAPPPAASNSPPTISGAPGTSVTTGQRYTFVPVASDPDGDTLGFSVENMPAWATFDTTTGRLSGTPAAADVGSYAGIRIVANDATHSTGLSPFSIQVAAPAAAAVTGAATLSWVPPTENTDGTAVTLRGYELRFGRSANVLDQTVALSNPSLNTYVVENLAAGTWFFALVAVSAEGISSEQSNVASKTIS
jgi:Putative Ig domain